MTNPLSPDLVNKLHQYMASGMGFFGQPVTLKKYVSASAGNPEFGIDDKLCYQYRPATMELRPLTIEESQMVGGQTIGGSYEYVSLEPVSLRDEVLFAGEVYRAVSYPDKEVIGETLYWKGIMQRASITGFYQ
jgi:hypothetical protein